MSAITGYKGRIILGSNVLRASRWTVQAHVDEQDVTTVAELGQRLFVPTIPRYDVSFEAFWDPIDNPFQNPLNLLPGQYSSPVAILPFKQPQQAIWQWTSVLWLTVETMAGVRDTIHFTLAGVATAFLLPSFSSPIPLTTLPYPYYS